ncbi:DUF4153 domain-containing protein [Mucilaginibacter ginsenosidivorax]|uniref:DUF4153 domain-containing protein n=1 Tax=Mucilaginibacter ginsenosidivorax TaxID=862126 RepID=A0A5B8W1U6_9SPHI|nr:DUF4153 domain-containing protein [Mucilaginibacter ginsenosidivorax]QEC76892.1 DUF4153 domain-containing protein [Mucilaginibacter ginsenosidivorax]
MKFPSIKTLAEGFLITIKRYPFELFFALIGTLAGTTEVELRHLNRVHEGWLMRGVMTANLGLLLSLSATLFTQSRQFSKQSKFIIKIITALFAASLVFIIDPTAREADYIRFFLLSLSFHLLVAFAAFTGKGQVNGFWQFNKTLFLRFLTSVLYGVVLFLGIAAAIAATNFLFNFKFEWDTYAILWVWIAGLFTTTFFLAGVPANTQSLNDDLTYPKALKIFTQFVLIPLSTIYVLILLAYEVKIIILWSLPKGLVSNLILSYAVFGVLSLLLVYPIREHDGNKWIKNYSRSFYFLLIPLLGLLFVAVGARVFMYGITEWRYFLIALACWLLFICVYFLAFKKQNIKLMPISLCIVTILSVYGPQSAFSVSMYSQRRIIVKFFEKHNALKNGKFIAVDSTKLSEKEGSKAVASLNYFIYKYDITPLQPYFNKNLTALSDSLGKLKSRDWRTTGDYGRRELRESKYEWARISLGLHHFETWYNENDNVMTCYYTFSKKEKILVVKGYDITLAADEYTDTLTNNFNGIQIKQTQTANGSFTLKLNSETFNFRPFDVARKFLADTATLNKYHTPTESEYYKNYDLPAKETLLIKETAMYKVAFQINSINFNITGKEKPADIKILGTYLIKTK